MHGIHDFNRHSPRPTYDDDEEEEECRVCREPAEDGRPLFQPCKCSGSIGLTHQDCLTSWLEVKGGRGKCDLCHHKFTFAPLYAPDAPESLSTFQCVYEIMIQLIREWLPLGIRFLFICFIWLGVLPLGTAYLYQGWMHRPSSIHERLNMDMIGNDIVQGGLLTLAIVVGFLSIMSLVDFFRSKWDKILALKHQGQEEQDDLEENILIQPDVVVQSKPSRILFPSSPYSVCSGDMNSSDSEQSFSSRRTERSTRQGFGSYKEVESDDHEDSASEDESLFARMMQIQEEQEDDVDVDNNVLEDSDDENNPLEGEVPIDGLVRNFLEREVPPGRVADPDVIDGMDVFDGELGMEFRHLVGMKGPLIDVIRSLLWVLAFLTAFIFLFICVPRLAGSVTIKLVTKSRHLTAGINYIVSKMLFALFDLKTRDGLDLDMTKLIKIMTEESEKNKSLIQPSDLGVVICGYLSYAMSSFVIRGCVDIYKYLSKPRLSTQDRVAEQIRNLHRLRRDVVNPEDMNAREFRFFLLKQLDSALDCAEAASKISLLVCFKMFVLPLLLGVWLDISTLRLFDTNVEDRISNAGADIIGSFLLHWVFGITFMLFITISVLQLREVLHPDILAPIIRPQDPQPDLLLQLLQDSGWTHIKRLVPSLTIYASLLFIHIWLPCRLILLLEVQESIPFFRPKFWYISNPTMQSSIELLIFHLSILSVLEKQKNTIGELQHYILLRLTTIFGISRNCLPFSVSSSLALVGEVQLSGVLDENNVGHTGHDNDEDFWKKLVQLDKEKGATDEFLETSLHLETPSEKSRWDEDISTPDSYIVIAHETSTCPRIVMRTRIGRYRFRKRIEQGTTMYAQKVVIEIWCESVDQPIRRPPEGWDYLGDGDTVEKGRWAWGKKEKKSDIELSVASRTLFFPPEVKNGQLMSQYRTPQLFTKGIPMAFKLCCITTISWMVATFATCTILFFPTFVGRWITHLLHIDENHIHDPFLFLLGCILSSPILVTFVKYVTNKLPVTTHSSIVSVPPLRKMFTLLEALLLWLFLCPLCVGFIYDTFFKIQPLTVLYHMQLSTLLSSWGVGFFLFHLIGGMSYYGMFRHEFLRKLWILAIESIAGGRGGEDNRIVNRRVENNPPQVEDSHIENRIKDCSDSWQGANGRIGLFVFSLYSALVRFEWDKVDREILLCKCLRPIFLNAVTTITLPLAGYIVSNALLGVGFSIYRSLILLALMTQITILLKDSITVWYRTVQKSARDHRYLIGKILLNYDQSQTKGV